MPVVSVRLGYYACRIRSSGVYLFVWATSIRLAKIRGGPETYKLLPKNYEKSKMLIAIFSEASLSTARKPIRIRQVSFARGGRP